MMKMGAVPASSILGLLAAALLITAASAATNVCFEKITDVPAVFLQEHPVGDVLVVATQDGLIRLLVRPRVQSGTAATNYSIFLNLTDRVNYQGEQGLLSFAFHPQFSTNGRFFVSYICDSTVHPDCQGPCACSAATNCTRPLEQCPLNTIVGEYSAGPDPLNSPSLQPTEVRKIFQFGRPGTAHNGGHIWFGTDTYLYFSSGDGVGVNGVNPSTSQNGLVPLGKILRVDVDAELNGTKSTFGSYAVPSTNPFMNNTLVAPEVYALGLRDPWRCSEDFVSTNKFCGEIGPNSIQEVDLLVPGGNYGWPYYDGHTLLSKAPTSLIGTNITGAVYVYNATDTGLGQAVIGGYVYRAERNGCLQGKYIFGDENGMMSVGTFEGNTSSVEAVVYSIASNPSKATINKDGLITSDSFPKGDRLLSWAVDNSQELYRLSTSGVYRVINSTICGGTCSGKIQVFGSPNYRATIPPPPAPPPSSARGSFQLLPMLSAFVLLVASVLLVV